MTGHVIQLLVLAVTMVTVQGAKILIVGAEQHSHAHSQAVAGKALIEAGHEVHFLCTPKYKSLVEENGLKGIYFRPRGSASPLEDPEFVKSLMMPISLPRMLSLMGKVSEAMGRLCHEMLGDAELEARLGQEGYDLALVESIDPVRCMMVIPYRHHISYVTLGMRHDPWTARLSASPSAEGAFGLNPYADPYNPTLMERWQAFLATCLLYVVFPPSAMSDDFITKYAPDRPAITMTELYQQAELHFMNMDTVCLDTPRASAPHYIFLGGMGTEPANPLTGDFKEFADSAKDGLVVVTFGSILKEIPMSRMEVMLAAFKQIPQRVVMRYDGPQPPEVPANVMLAKWIPQNDLLGHPGARLFITHGGGGGQMEAFYHGVPFVTLPLYAEQHYNAERGVARGFGAMLDFHTFTVGDLVSAVKQVIEDPSYSYKLKNCLAKFRFMPNPQKTFTFWVEHVIKHGGDHLKPPAMKMPLWRWFNLDILFICFILIHANIHIAKFIFKGVRFAIRKIKGNKSKSD